MENDIAQTRIDEVRCAYLAASRPMLARRVCAVSAFGAGAGVALIAQGEPGWEHLAFVAGGVLLLTVAHLVPTFIRSRSGLHGYRGWTKTENTTLLLCALTLVICGFSSGRELRWIFAGLGVISAGAWYAMLRGALTAGGRPDA